MEKSVVCINQDGYYGVGESLNRAYSNLINDPLYIGDNDNSSEYYEDEEDLSRKI